MTTATLETTPGLGHLFASGAREAVLRVLMLDPSRGYYQRQLEQATGLPIRAVQRELERLTEAGLLRRRQESNRVYYHVDMEYVFFPELRSMVLKTSQGMALFRAQLAMDPGVRAAFWDAAEHAVLVVTETPQRGQATHPQNVRTREVTGAAFLDALSKGEAAIVKFLTDGVDLLGRREDSLWRRIEAAGYSVAKGAGIP